MWKCANEDSLILLSFGGGLFSWSGFVPDRLNLDLAVGSLPRGVGAVGLAPLNRFIKQSPICLFTKTNTAHFTKTT